MIEIPIIYKHILLAGLRQSRWSVFKKEIICRMCKEQTFRTKNMIF